ncbi:MAG: hypothetical protein UHG68_03410, partial [Clostridia bacterium]|nr:hypothetical protein [Clostridia bacterium]
MATTGKELLEKYKKKKQETAVSTDKTTISSGTAKTSITGSQLLDKYYGRNVEGDSQETSFTFSDEGKSGWQKYLDDQEAAKQQAIAEEEGKSWWEQFLDIYSGVVLTNPSDNPTPISQIKAYEDDVSYMRPSDDWSDEQRDAFGKLYLESPEKAFSYAKEANKQNSAAKEAAEIEKIQNSATGSFGSGVGHTIGAIATAPLGLIDFFDDLTKKAAGREITADGFLTPFEYSQAVTGGISQGLNDTYGTLDEAIPIIGGKGLGDVYGLGTSIAQSALSGLTLGGGGTLVSYFGQGAAAGVDEALSRGASEDQALLYGTLLGTFEG